MREKETDKYVDKQKDTETGREKYIVSETEKPTNIRKYTER